MLSTLVLTAGLGTRLDPITRIVAKAAVPLGDRTLVERVLGWLEGQGVRRVVLNLHHHPASIAAVVGDGAHLGLQVRYSWEHPLLGSAGGPRHALPLLDDDPWLIVNGDTLCDVDLPSMLDAHRASRASVTMALIPNPAPDRYNGVILAPDGAVSGFVPKGQTQGTWHFIGVQIVSRAAFADLPDGQPAETVKGVYREMLARQPGLLRGYPVATSFLDIGTPRDYLETALYLGVSENAGSSRVTRSIVWPSASVAQGARLDRVIVAGNARVPAGLEARDAVVVPARFARPDDVAATVHGDIAVFPFP